MALSAYEILTLNAIIVPALIALWTLFIQRGTVEPISRFRAVLRDFQKRKAKSLLEEIREAEKKADEEEAMKDISEYGTAWSYVTKAIADLEGRESNIHRWGKIIIFAMVFTFLFGMYASGDPDKIITGQVTNLGALYMLFAVEVVSIAYWIWQIFDFSKILGRTIAAKPEDIEKVIRETVLRIKAKEETSF